MTKLMKLALIAGAVWALSNVWLSGPANDLALSLAGVAFTCAAGVVASALVIWR